ncbi:MAG: TonB-dependent receptor [Acidobacteria bacterium]|nr:TonB-dependent receptor [Acidobacteriota bacterium]
MKKNLMSGLLLIITLLAGTVHGWTQSTTGTISGTVSDESGAVLPGAQVAASNTATGAHRTVSTDAVGRYVITQLPPGSYDISSSMTGFGTLVRQGVTLALSQQVTLHLAMRVGAVSEQVTVTGEAPLVNTSSGTVSGVVDETRIQQLPLNGRDFSQLPLVQTGVTDVLTGDNAMSKGTGARISMGGSRVDQTAWLLDGTNIHSPSFFGTPGGAAGVMLGVDAVREFQVLTSNYSAEVGGSSGGVINMVTKSGTNTIHGTLFHSIRNSAVNARAMNDIPDKAALKWNQYGGAIGGPIRQDRTFFFANYESIIRRSGATQSPLVPDDALRLGLVPDTNAPGGRRQVNVAASVRPYLDIWPRANSGAGVHFFSSPNPINEHYVVGRLDHAFNDKQSLFLRFTLDNGDITSPDPLPITNTETEMNTRYATLGHDYIISPTFLLSTRLAANRTLLGSDEIALVDYPVSLNKLLPGYLFSVGYTGVTSIGINTQNVIRHAQTLFTLDERAQYIRGAHAMKFGVQIDRVESSRRGGSAGLNGSMGWSSAELFLTDARPLTFSAAAPGLDNARTYLQYLYGVFLQDDWKIRPHFTLNLGVRYDPSTGPDERHGRESTVNDWTTATAFQTDIGLFNNPSKRNISPRVGFAWDPKGDGMTAVRGGFGLFFMQLLSAHYVVQGAKNQPYFATTSAILGNLASVEADLAANRAALLSPNFGGEITFLEITQWDLNPSYEMKFNLSVERQFSNSLSVTLGYLGGRGIHLWRNTDVNNSPYVLDASGRPLVVAGTPRVNPRAGVGQTRYSDAQSFYNGLQVEVKKRMSSGFQLQTSYTWSKSVDDSTTGVANTDYNEGSASQAYLTKADRGLSALHVGQNIAVNGIWAIPSSADSGLVSHILGGWQLSGIFRAKSGTPFSVKVTSRNAPDQSRGANLQRPELAPGRNQENITAGTTAGCGTGAGAIAAGQALGTPTRYYDPCAFVRPPVPVGFAVGSGYFGNLGRNTLTGPGLVNFDFSLSKSVPLGLSEGSEIKLQADAFNIFNRNNLGLPATGALNPLTGAYIAEAGRINTQVTRPRQMQFGLKLIF